jgi:very-short-patch-repair endonuclease
METTFTKARRLRREMTPAERQVWRYLRGRGLRGFKFRRQVPVGSFIIDFLCVEAGLIVEIDGDSHSNQLAYDRRRTMYLETQGYRVIRISKQQVRESMDGSLHIISSSLP